MRVLDLKGLSGAHRIVWEATYEYQQQHRNEYDNVSYSLKEGVVHIIAANVQLAKEAFRHRYPSGYKLRHLVAVLVVDLEVSLSDGRSL